MQGIGKKIQVISYATLSLAFVFGVVSPVFASSFPGYNGKIMFVSNRSGNNEIYTMNLDGTNVTNLTNNPLNDIEPSWSADGTKIAFVSNRTGANELYTMNYDGSGLLQLTTGATARTPSWFPSQNKIVYATFRHAATTELETINADGTNDTRLTNNATTDIEPTVSPDGTKIAYRGQGTSPDIFVMNSDGTGVTQVSNNTGNDFAPSWAVDGSHLVFFNAGLSVNNDMYRINVNGTGQAAFVTGVNGDHHPSYSPEGTKLIFSSSRSGNDDIYMMNPDTTGTVNLTNNAATDSTASIQPLTLPPTLGADTASGQQDQAVTADVLTNDTDHYGSFDTASMTIQSVSGGTAVLNGNQTITFTPASGFTGTGQVTYRICSAAHTSLCSTAVLSINVSALPATPSPTPNETLQLAATGQSPALPFLAGVTLLLGGIYSKIRSGRVN